MAVNEHPGLVIAVFYNKGVKAVCRYDNEPDTPLAPCPNGRLRLDRQAGDDEALVAGELTGVLARVPLGAGHDAWLEEVGAGEVLGDLRVGPPGAPAEGLLQHLFHRGRVRVAERAEVRDEQRAARRDHLLD